MARMPKRVVSFIWLVVSVFAVAAFSSARAAPQAAGRIIVPEAMIMKKIVRQMLPWFSTSEPVIQQFLRSRTDATVRFRVVLDVSGKVSEIHLLSGDPRLVARSRAVVKEWRFEPSVFDGELVEVETTVTVSYHLSS